jgi:prepilin-type N-terminal cleavage/methylation domain-containing protein
MRARLRSERGMTLPELLVTMTIALILSMATFALIDVTIRRSGEIEARVDAVGRGRVAMDLITRQLRSQICLGAAPARSVTEATPTSVTFYIDLGDPSTKAGAVTATATATPVIAERHSVSLENNVLVERRWVGTPSASDAPGYTFPAQPTSTRELLKPVEMVTPKDPALPPALFRYFAYDTTLAKPTPTKLLTPATGSLNDVQLRQVAKIQVDFRALPSKARPDHRASTEFVTDVALRTVDPNADMTELNAPCL